MHSDVVDLRKVDHKPDQSGDQQPANQMDQESEVEGLFSAIVIADEVDRLEMHAPIPVNHAPDKRPPVVAPGDRDVLTGLAMQYKVIDDDASRDHSVYVELFPEDFLIDKASLSCVESTELRCSHVLEF